MKQNMSLSDRNIRLLLAVSIVVLYFLNVMTGALAVALLVIIGILLATSFFRICPLYLPFGISTKRKLDE